MKFSIQDIAILMVCFTIPAVLLLLIHVLDVTYFVSLRNSSDGQIWVVLVLGELFFLISRFIRKQ